MERKVGERKKKVSRFKDYIKQYKKNYHRKNDKDTISTRFI